MDIIQVKDKAELRAASNGYWNPKWDSFTFYPNKEYVLLRDGDNYSLQSRQTAAIVAAHYDPAHGLNYNSYYQQFADITQEQRDKYRGSYHYECGEAVKRGENTEVWTTNKKARFRETPQWREFRDAELKKRALYKCDDCGYIFKNLEVHHLIPLQYDDLTPSHFKCLCRKCHEKLTERGE